MPIVNVPWIEAAHSAHDVHMYLGNGKVLEAHHSPMFKVEKIDAGARTTSLELLQSVMDHHGAGVSRMVEPLDASETGRTSLAKLGSDPLVCGLLVLYGVHPVAFSDRVARAVELAGLNSASIGGSAELLAVRWVSVFQCSPQSMKQSA